MILLLLEKDGAVAHTSAADSCHDGRIHLEHRMWGKQEPQVFRVYLFCVGIHEEKAMLAGP